MDAVKSLHDACRDASVRREVTFIGQTQLRDTYLVLRQSQMPKELCSTLLPPRRQLSLLALTQH